MRMFNEEEIKDEQCSSPSKRPKNVQCWKWGCSRLENQFLEREGVASL